MSGMLASVENLAEALLVLEAGADIIDLKSPSAGALGALPLATVRDIVQVLVGRRPVSATIGDMPMHPQSVVRAVESMAATGVDYVKIGFFPDGDWRSTVVGLSPLAAQGIRLVAVLFGDLSPSLGQVTELAAAGFSAAMLDTMDKHGGSLTEVCSLDYLRAFVAETKAQGMLCGLAGSLRPADIPVLANCQADYLGFRGALCLGRDRTAGLDTESVRAIRRLLG